MSPGRGVLQITAHHLAYDGTFILVWDELLALYRLEIGETEKEPPQSESYDRFVQFEHDYLRSPRAADDRRYWHDKLAGSKLRLDVGCATRERSEDWLMMTVPIAFEGSLAAGIFRLANEYATTPYVVMATVYVLALHDEFAANDVVVASSVSLRDMAELQTVVGPLINFIALRVDLSGALSFEEALARVRETIAEALSYRLYPFGMLVEELADPEQLAEMPRLGLNVDFNYYNLDGLVRGSESAWLRASGFIEVGGGVRAANYPVQGLPVIRPYDLTLGAFQAGGQLSASLCYNVRLLDADAGERIVQRFLGHLEQGLLTSRQDAALKVVS